MSPFQDMLIYHADFNSLLSDGAISVSRRYASSPRTPENDERVLLRDDEGNSYEATVTGADERVVHVVADMSTWKLGEVVEWESDGLSPLDDDEPFGAVSAQERAPEFAIAD